MTRDHVAFQRLLIAASEARRLRDLDEPIAAAVVDMLGNGQARTYTLFPSFRAVGDVRPPGERVSFWVTAPSRDASALPSHVIGVSDDGDRVRWLIDLREPVAIETRRRMQTVSRLITELCVSWSLQRREGRWRAMEMLIGQLAAGLSQVGNGLQDRLDVLARVIGGQPGVTGAMVIALDDRRDPIAAGSHQLFPAVSPERRKLQTLHVLCQTLYTQSSSEWSRVPVDSLDVPHDALVLFYPVRHGEVLAGYLLVRQAEAAASPLDSRIMVGLATFCYLPIREAIQGEALRRLQALRRLVRELAPDQLDLPGLMVKLKELFNADMATLWLEVEQTLWLSASSDPSFLRGGARCYKPNQGLTGRVWTKNRTVSLIDTRDHRAICQTLSIHRYDGPVHPEFDLASDEEYTQYLGVPIRSWGAAIGVIRMVRLAGALHFSPEEQSALEMFGELLGLALHDTVRRTVLDEIWRSAKTSFIVSHGKRVTLASPGAGALFGRPIDKLMGMPVQDLYVPGDFQRVERELHRATREGRTEVGPFVVYMKRPDQTDAPAELNFHLFTNRWVVPPQRYTLGVATDISLRHSGAAGFAQLTQILDELGIVYFRALKDGTAVFSTPGEERLTGYTRQELQGDRNVLWLDRSHRELLFAELRNNPGRIVRKLIQLRHKSGRPLPAYAQVRLIQDGDREVIEGLYEDVSGRLKLQDYLDLSTDRWVDDNTLLHRLEQDASDRLMYQSTLGHQLKTPLFALIANLRELEQGRQPLDKTRGRIGSLIGQALVAWRQADSFFHIDEVLIQQQLDPEQVRPISLIKLILDVVQDFHHTAKEDSLNVEVDRRSLRPRESLIAHPKLLEQVISNLLDNAIKYARPGTNVFIRAARDHDGPGFEISSRGSLVEADERSKLFSKGFRGRRAQAIGEGSGLGLWFSQRVARLHGGEIRYVPEPDGPDGSRNVFVVTLGTPPGQGGRDG